MKIWKQDLRSDELDSIIISKPKAHDRNDNEEEESEQEASEPI